MAVFNEPTQWDHPLGNNAEVNDIPDDTSAGSGDASLQKLFQVINQTPLKAGGKAPKRKDINALFKILGDYIYYSMNGGVPAYNNTYDYVVGRLVLFTDGNIYKCIQANGASSTVVTPDSTAPNPEGSDYWKRIDEPSAALIPNQLVISPTPLTDANLHLLDGALLGGSGVYADYVTMMADLYNDDPTANIWTDEATWQASVTNTGSCGKFVYDSVNNTLRLPKYDARYLKSTLSASDLGDLVEAAAPNIKGVFSIKSNCQFVGAETGAFYVNNPGAVESQELVTAQSTYNYAMNLTNFDANRSNPIYKDSATTIDTDAVKVYYYIVLGTVTKTQIQIDIDNVLTDLANKADKDFSNVSAPVQAFKNMSIGWVVPDYTAGISISSGFTAPSIGFIAFLPFDNSGNIYINGIDVMYFSDVGAGGNGQTGYLLVDKNDVFTATGDWSYFKFYPCKGVN